MLIPCEVAIKCVLPVIRAMLTKELIATHNLKQIEVAELLGISQPAVSLYGKKIRGQAIDLEKEEDIVTSINGIAISLVNGKISQRDFVSKICEVCRIVRGRGLMCMLHKNFDPNFNIETCNFCTGLMLKCV